MPHQNPLSLTLTFFPETGESGRSMATTFTKFTRLRGGR